MKPVYQNIFPDEQNPMRGNCFSACLASLLELPIEEVPNFHDHKDLKGRDNFWGGVIEFLSPRQLGFVEVRIDTDELALYPVIGGMYVVLTGNTKRHPTRLHAVVGKTVGVGTSIEWEFIHDPHPDGDFLTEVKMIGWLIPFDPKGK